MAPSPKAKPAQPTDNPRMNPFLDEIYPCPPVWRRNDRGNLTLDVGRFRLTVFEQPSGSGRFKWSRAAGLGRCKPEFSPVSYATEEEAIVAAGEAART